MNRMTELLERINYDLPGLEKAKMCYAQGDADGAMDAVIEHFRTRTTPKYLFTAKEMEQFAPIYYCHPYSSWERGTNENRNGRIRRYLPKKTSFDGLTDEDLQAIVDEINDTPMKVLDWETPNEVWYRELGKVLSKTSHPKTSVALTN